MVVPVGCVEQGRWSWVGERFSAGAGKSGWRLRADSTLAKMRRRAEGHGPTLDQGRLWRQVDAELAAARLSSSSQDYCLLVGQRQRQFEQVRPQLRPLPNQVGVLVLHGGTFVGLEAFAAPGAWLRSADRVLDSIIDAGAALPAAAPPAAAGGAGAWLGILQNATVVRQAAIDLGEDLELSGPGFFGEAVWLGDHPAHVCVFGR